MSENFSKVIHVCRKGFSSTRVNDNGDKSTATHVKRSFTFSPFIAEHRKKATMKGTTETKGEKKTFDKPILISRKICRQSMAEAG